jgi:hypothetical protein
MLPLAVGSTVANLVAYEEVWAVHPRPSSHPSRFLCISREATTMQTRVCCFATHRLRSRIGLPRLLSRASPSPSFSSVCA